ncbi:MAG: Crp/Fnr family transcriptional regulator [Propionibacteriaceae bacterium]|nr:Crp/Fnr family transcriptional regulator [Propionibacteriaceae bacterium]
MADSCVTRVPVFRTLTPDQQAEVARFARPVHVAAGEQVMTAGSTTRRLLVVHSGRVRLVHLLDSGREHLVRMLGEGDAVGETSFVLGSRPEHFAFADTDAQLCTFDHEDLAGLVARYPEIAVRMLQVQAERLAAAERMLAAFGSADVGARVAAYLLDLPVATGPTGNHRVELPMAKKDVASYLGTTPETLSRRLRELTDAGAIELDGRRGVIIRDVDGLIRRAEA